jgi:hypothetical protein
MGLVYFFPSCPRAGSEPVGFVVRVGKICNLRNKGVCCKGLAPFSS